MLQDEINKYIKFAPDSERASLVEDITWNYILDFFSK